uniref:Uncharacterized protein n=1 Tax=Cacopsylla melanoneura TaxID=428564 RepID=A0A8D8UJG0_9HEMI
MFQTRSASQAARTHSHGRSTVRVYVLWQGVPTESGAEPARAAAHGRETVRVRDVRRKVPPNDDPETAHAQTSGRGGALGRTTSEPGGVRRGDWTDTERRCRG